MRKAVGIPSELPQSGEDFVHGHRLLPALRDEVNPLFSGRLFDPLDLGIEHEPDAFAQFYDRNAAAVLRYFARRTASETTT